MWTRGAKMNENIGTPKYTNTLTQTQTYIEILETVSFGRIVLRAFDSLHEAFFYSHFTCMRIVYVSHKQIKIFKCVSFFLNITHTHIHIDRSETGVTAYACDIIYTKSQNESLERDSGCASVRACVDRFFFLSFGAVQPGPTP